MKRYMQSNNRWYYAILPPGVHPLDHDAAQRVMGWIECEPPPHARPGRLPALPARVEWDGWALLAGVLVLVAVLIVAAVLL